MLKEAAVKIYREKRAYLPSMVPEAYYGITNAPEESNILDKAQNIGRSYMGGLTGQAKGTLYGGALGGLYGVFNPFRSKTLGGTARSFSTLLDTLLHGAAGAAIGGTYGRLRGAHKASLPVQELPDNVYDARGTNV